MAKFSWASNPEVLNFVIKRRKKGDTFPQIKKLIDENKRFSTIPDIDLITASSCRAVYHGVHKRKGSSVRSTFSWKENPIALCCVIYERDVKNQSYQDIALILNKVIKKPGLIHTPTEDACRAIYHSTTKRGEKKDILKLYQKEYLRLKSPGIKQDGISMELTESYFLPLKLSHLELELKQLSAIREYMDSQIGIIKEKIAFLKK